MKTQIYYQPNEQDPAIYTTLYHGPADIIQANDCIVYASAWPKTWETHPSDPHLNIRVKAGTTVTVQEAAAGEDPNIILRKETRGNE